MSVSPDRGDDLAPEKDLEQWQALSREEQAERLIAKRKEDQAERRATPDDEPPAWDRYDDDAQAATVEQIESGGEPTADDGSAPADEELSATERAMQRALDATWTAECFEYDDDKPTVPFECRELTDAEQEMLLELASVGGRAERAVEDVESEAEAEAAAAEAVEDMEHFEDGEQAEEWLCELLEDVTQDDGFDKQRWKTGDRMVANTRSELVMEIASRYQEETQRAASFRQKRLR